MTDSGRFFADLSGLLQIGYEVQTSVYCNRGLANAFSEVVATLNDEEFQLAWYFMKNFTSKRSEKKRPDK